MSIPQTQIKGSVALASDAGSTTTIGNDTGTTTIKSSTINIENETQTDNLAQIRIGATTGLFDSNTTLAGKTTITKLATPLTPSYTIAPTVNQVGYIAPLIGNATDPLLKPDPYTIAAGFTNYSLAKVDLTAGTWIITTVITANSNANAGYVINAITPLRDNINFTTDYYVQSLNSSTVGLGYIATRTVQITASQSYFLTTRTNVLNQVVGTYKMQAVRIA